MNKERTVIPGKIVTILFEGPNSKPIEIVINDGEFHEKLGVVYISPKAPLSQAILNHQAGDKIWFHSPEGKLIVRIVKIQ